MQNFSNEELERLKTYIDMQKDMNRYRGYDQHIKDIQAEMQARTATLEHKAHLQAQLEADQHAKETFPDDIQKKYQAGSLLNLSTRMQAIEHELYPRVIAHSPMRDTHEAIYDLRKQQRLEEWKQPARTPRRAGRANRAVR